MDLLKPGCLMSIGLYSEIARQHIVAAWTLVAQMGLSDLVPDMRDFRSKIIDPGNDLPARLGKLTDSVTFYSRSEFRDFLFHVQEHRFTLPQIETVLGDLGLIFAGFELADHTLMRKFAQEYPGPDAPYSLSAWHDFEIANPDSFRGMYQFWVQKPIRPLECYSSKLNRLTGTGAA